MFKKFNKELYAKIGIALTVLIVTVAVILGAWRTVADKTVPLENAAEVYTQAVERLTAAKNTYYKVSGTKITTVNDASTEESFTQLITYEEINSENFRGFVEEDLLIGSHSIKSFEFFSDGVAYFTTQGASFQSEISAEEYTDRYTPVVPVNSSLYAEITGSRNSTASTISFAKPGAVELWVGKDGVALKDASASAIISPDGDLTTSTYAVTYTRQDTTVSLHVTVEVIYSTIQPIQIPDSSVYAPISDISVPKTLEQSCGYLTSIKEIYAVYTDTIFCEAFGDERTQTINLTINRSDDWSASADTTILISNSSKAGVISTCTKSESFEKGVYSYTLDGADPLKDSSVDQAAMESYCENLLLGTILLPDYIKSAQVTESGDTIQIAFQPSDDFANILAQDACLMLYQNATVLIEQALSYETDDVTCYLTIDRITGYPVASGFYYSGTYVVGGIPYQLSFRADQSYALAAQVNKEESTDTTEYTEAQEAEAS